MVNNPPVRLLVTGACNVVVRDSGRSIITNGPVYCLETAKKHLLEHGLRVVTDGANDDMCGEFAPELEDDELVAFISQLTPDDLVGSERCGTSIGRTLDCDAYAMKWNRNKRARWHHGLKIYVKFGFSDNSPFVLVVSIHPSKY